MGCPVPATALERPIEGFGSFSGCLLRTGNSIRIGWAVPRVAMMRNFLSNQSLWKFLWTEIAALLAKTPSPPDFSLLLVTAPPSVTN